MVLKRVLAGAEAALVLRAVAGKRPAPSGWVRAPCPFCVVRRDHGSANRRKLNFHPDAGFYCCFRCGARGWVGDHSPAGVDRVDPGVFEDPSDYTPILDEDIAASTYCEPAREYLRSRGVTVQIQREAMIGISLRGRDANRIIVPCLDASGAWWGWVGRSWAPGRQRRYQTAPKMRRDQLYNAVALERITDDPVIVVEGVFDALPFWPDACACLGKPGDAQRRSLLETTRPIVVCLDGDAWEEGEQLANWLRFNDARAIAIRLPPAEDPGSMGQAWVRDAVSAALGGRTK